MALIKKNQRIQIESGRTNRKGGRVYTTFRRNVAVEKITADPYDGQRWLIGSAVIEGASRDVFKDPAGNTWLIIPIYCNVSDHPAVAVY